MAIRALYKSCNKMHVQFTSFRDVDVIMQVAIKDDRKKCENWLLSQLISLVLYGLGKTGFQLICSFAV